MRGLGEKYVGELELIESPRYIFFGPGALEKTGETIRSLEIKGKAFIVTGGENTSPIAWRLGHSIEADGYKFEVFEVTSSHPDVRDIERAHEKLREFDAGFVIGVGGGRVLDVAKLTAHWAGLRYISVPTSASHDGIASPAISFLLSKSVEEVKGKEWAKPESPSAVIADTRVIRKAPDITRKSGFGDLMAKLTAVRDWELAHKLKDEPFSEYAASMSLLSARLAMEHAEDIRPGTEESTRLLVKALIGSGVAISIAGSSRPASGSEHLFSHALDLLAIREGYRNAPHGIQCGLGAIMMAYLQGQDWEKIRDSLKAVGAPTTAKEAGLDPEVVIKALTIAHTIRKRYTILGESGLTEAAARKLAMRTGVIG